MKPINKEKIGNFFKGLIREGLQTLPIVGTLVTSFKTETKDSPKGQIKLSKWDIYRLVLGFGLAYVLAKGILTQDQIAFIMQYVPF